jgi:hypothetical protein
MSTLVSSITVASEAMARDPTSPGTAESIASTVRAIDEFLAGPPMTVLRQLEPEAKAAILPGIAREVRLVIERLRNMLLVAAKAERFAGPLSWTPRLAEAIGRFEGEFGELWRVEEPTPVYRTAGASTPDPLSDEALDDALEDTMDLIRAQHTEAMARVRNEELRDFEAVRRELNLDRD